jgi:sugar lactone lactonase YvrE
LTQENREFNSFGICLRFKILRKPAGIALDQNSNVFVAGNGTNNVVVLSPDGKNCRQILTKYDVFP